jgi:hypothetical protein
MPAVQVHAAVGRRCGRRHLRGRNDCVRARSRRFLGGVVRALSDDLPRARGPGQESRRGAQSRKGRRRREPRTRRQVRGAVDPVAGRDPGRSRDRPSCGRASSRCAGAAVAASARGVRLSRARPSAKGRVSRPGVARAASQRRPRRGCEGCNASPPTRGRPKDVRARIRSYAGAIGRPDRDDRIAEALVPRRPTWRQSSR